MLQGVWNINFFCQSLKITSDILRYIRYSALKCHLAAAFCFIINVAWFIFSDLSSDAWAFSCVYTKRYIIYGQNSQSQEFQQNNLLKSCIGSLVKSENCNRTASPPDLAHCAPPPLPLGVQRVQICLKRLQTTDRERSFFLHIPLLHSQVCFQIDKINLSWNMFPV